MLRRLVDGDYDGAFKILKFAGRFEGVYYRKGTAKNESFSHTVKLMQYMILHLSDEFKVCSPDMRKTARGGSAGNENKTGSRTMPCKDPYFLIEGAVECLARGDHKGADTLLNDASESIGRYFSPGSGKDRDQEQAIEFIRYILHNYPDEFMTDRD